MEEIKFEFGIKDESTICIRMDIPGKERKHLNISIVYSSYDEFRKDWEKFKIIDFAFALRK